MALAAWCGLRVPCATLVVIPSRWTMACGPCMTKTTLLYAQVLTACYILTCLCGPHSSTRRHAAKNIHNMAATALLQILRPQPTLVPCILPECAFATHDQHRTNTGPTQDPDDSTFKHEKGEWSTGAVKSPNGDTKITVDVTRQSTALYTSVTLSTLHPPKVTVLGLRPLRVLQLPKPH